MKKVVKMKKPSSSFSLFSIFPMAIYTFIFVALPLMFLVAISFSTRSENGVSFDFIFTLSNYQTILEPVYLNTFVSSFKLGLISTLLVTLLGYPFGYFMARLSSRWKGRISAFLMIPFWVNSLLRLNGWRITFISNGILDKLLMGLGLTDSPLRLLNTYPAVVVGMVYALLPFMIFSVYSSAEKLDWTLMEASRDLGASSWQSFRTVAFPLTLPGLMSGVILTFIPSMGLFYIAQIFGGGKVPLVGSLIQENAGNQPFAAALSVVLMVLTTLSLFMYSKLFGGKELEGI